MLLECVAFAAALSESLEVKTLGPSTMTSSASALVTTGSGHCLFQETPLRCGGQSYKRRLLPGSLMRRLPMEASPASS